MAIRQLAMHQVMCRVITTSNQWDTWKVNLNQCEGEKTLQNIYHFIYLANLDIDDASTPKFLSKQTITPNKNTYFSLFSMLAAIVFVALVQGWKGLR